MAIDTAQKRYSLIGLGSPTPRLLPIPQGRLGADDRALLLFLYTGFTAEAETSGGWRPRLPRRPREESEEDRDARIHAERVQMGIIQAPERLIAPPLAPPSKGGEGAGGIKLQEAWTGPPPRDLAADIAEEAALRLAGLYTSAYIDAEIARHFREQDDDDEAVLLIAIAATLH